MEGEGSLQPAQQPATGPVLCQITQVYFVTTICP